LLRAIEGTGRGARANEEQKRAVDEACLALEGKGAKAPTDEALQGDWDLIYTTEADVHAALKLLPSADVGQRVDLTQGRIQNRILTGQNGLGLRAGAPLTVKNGRRIVYNFDVFTFCFGSGLELPYKLGKKGPGGWTETVYLDKDIRVQRNSRRDVLVLRRLAS